MTPKEITERILTLNTLPPLTLFHGLGPEVTVADLIGLARDYQALTAPLMVKCRDCEGEGRISIADPAIAAIRKRFEDAPHEPYCNYIVYSIGGQPFPCTCWKSTFGLDALLDRLTAEANQRVTAEAEVKRPKELTIPYSY